MLLMALQPQNSFAFWRHRIWGVWCNSNTRSSCLWATLSGICTVLLNTVLSLLRVQETPVIFV